jgi:hypothetical protein
MLIANQTVLLVKPALPASAGEEGCFAASEYARRIQNRPPPNKQKEKRRLFVKIYSQVLRNLTGGGGGGGGG